jgi:hypothetical protein
MEERLSAHEEYSWPVGIGSGGPDSCSRYTACSSLRGRDACSPQSHFACSLTVSSSQFPVAFSGPRQNNSWVSSPCLSMRSWSPLVCL